MTGYRPIDWKNPCKLGRDAAIYEAGADAILSALRTGALVVMRNKARLVAASPGIDGKYVFIPNDEQGEGMRILGFVKKWEKLESRYFTTFRFPRKDKDWYEGEIVQVFYRPRSEKRELLCRAMIVNITPRKISEISDPEAVADGFDDAAGMLTWLQKTYGKLNLEETMNKITLGRVL